MPDFAVLHLCSWYPTPFRPEHGIFHQSHIRSASIYSKQVMVYVAFNDTVKDKKKHNYSDNNFHEYITILPKRKGFFLKSINFFIWLKAYKDLIAEVKKNHPDIRMVHLHVVFPVGIIYLIFNEIKKLPLIISEHWSGYYPEDGNYKGWFRIWITRQLFRKCKKVLVCSDKLGNRLMELKLAKKYTFMENVLPDYFIKDRIHSKKNNLLFHFLHVSSLTDREKNISGMLNVFLKLKWKNRFDFMLTIIGGSDEVVEHYRNWVSSHGLENNIVFTGSILNHALPSYYEKADAFVLFSHFESQPVVVLEAWSMGVPVLCTPVGQLPEWMKPEFGACAQSGKEEDLLNLLINAPDIIKNSDANEMRRFIKENFSAAVVGKKLNKIYNELLTELSA
jgi:glycosyltransferase involved in cell wall biosynthesis